MNKISEPCLSCILILAAIYFNVLIAVVMPEQLLNVINSPLALLAKKLVDNTTFYLVFTLGEITNTSSKKFFIWKSANFADSYWFLYNDKLSLHETNTLKQ